MNRGVLYAVLAFTSWGLYPLYFQFLAHVPALEVVLHRALWSLVFVLAVLVALRGRQALAWLGTLWRQPRRLAVYALSASLIALNWLIYVWAVANGQVLQASLGYFINPLFNVALGVLVLGERLRRVQWAAVALAGAGVAWMTWAAGSPPWVALALAGLFSTYGLVRKTTELGALEGLAVESMWLFVPALAGLLWLAHSTPGGATLVTATPALWAWLVASGPLTVLPLWWFAAAARRMPLATLGVIQYLSPTLQFLCGVWVFGEAFGGARAVGFDLIWAALLIYSLDALRRLPLRPGSGS
jgi:chloramphenicol-sensitive protein RarD